MKTSQKLIFFAAVFVLLLISAAAVQPQLSADEQSAIVEAVVQTMTSQDLKATVVAEVEADLIAKFTAAGYVGVAGAIAVPLEPTPTVAPEVIETTVSETEVPETAEAAETAEEPVSDTGDTAADEAAEEPAEAAADGKQYDDVKDFYDGAVLQEDGTYRGLHAKQVNAYAYTIGEDEDGVVTQFHTEYTPNVRFNVDVVFENDGSVIWPARVEMRHVGNVGEYTGHAESVYIDRTYDPVKPGDRAAFTVSAYGSENLGWTTFYFQLYDAVSGSAIEGGYGSFTYLAY